MGDDPTGVPAPDELPVPPPWGWPPPPGWGQPTWGGGPPGWAPPGAGGPPPGWGPPPPPAYGAPGSWPGYPAPTPPASGPQIPPRRRGLTIVALVAGAVLLAAAIGIPTAILVSRSGTTSAGAPSATSTPTPSQRAAAAQATALYQAMVKASDRSVGFHYVVTSSGSGGTQTTTGDAGQDDGTQVITETTPYGDEMFDLMLASDQTVYFEGNVPALEDQLGVSATAASGLSGDWISVQVGDGPYAQLQVAITVDSQLQQDPLVPTSTATVTGSGGATLTRILGTVPVSDNTPDGGTAHFDVSPSTDLPTDYVMSVTGGGSSATFTTTFTSWGTAPSVTVPSSSTAWTTLPTAEPQGGYGDGEGPAPSASPAPTPTPGGTGSV